MLGAGAQRHGPLATAHPLSALAQQGHPLGHVGQLGVAGQRAHAHTLYRRVAHHHLGQPGAQCGGHGVQLATRHDGAADGGALLAGLHRHLARHLLDEQLEFGVVGRDIGRQDRAVQGIGLGVEGHAVAHQVGMDAQPGGRVGAAGEGEHILALQAVQQITGGADHQLQRTLGQDARLHDQPHRRLGQVAGGGGRLADAGHARQEAGRQLFQQAPDRKVEGVDVHRHAAARHQDVAAGKLVGLAQRHGRAFVHQVARGQLVAAGGSVGQQGAAAAFDVDPAIGAGGAGVGRHGVQRFLVLVQVLGQRLEPISALLKIQLHQVGQAHAAGVVQRFGKVDRLGMGVGHRLAVDRAAQRL